MLLSYSEKVGKNNKITATVNRGWVSKQYHKAKFCARKSVGRIKVKITKYVERVHESACDEGFLFILGL